MTGRACQTVRQTWPCFAALDRSRLLRPDTSPPWNSPPASPRSFSTSTGPDFALTGPSRHDPPRHAPPAAATSAPARIARRNRRAETSQVSVDSLLRREGTSRNGWQPTADALLTMRLKRQLVAVGGNGLGLIEPFSRARHLRPVATGCNHGAP